jgi:flagellar biosynthesis protein FlhG
MTRIITITSGLTQIGKTHLAVNLALEMVRRGRRAGLYHELHSATPVDALLALQQAAPPRRRATDSLRTDKVVRRGYLGIDILGCELPLQQLAQLPAGQLERCIESMDAEDGYDDFLIDTSGMEPHALLACCTAAALVILVVTADPHSQAEAFALLRVLQLNGFEGELRLLVNRVPYAVDSGEIQQRLGSRVQRHLGIELPLLGTLVEDRHIGMAQQSRQAFSALFPDSEAAGCMVVLVDALDELAAAASGTLAEFWSDFLERVRTPVQLAGDIQLETLTAADELFAQQLAVEVPGQGDGIGLLHFDGDLHGLCTALEQAPSSLQVLAADVSSLAASLVATAATPDGGFTDRVENAALPGMAAVLLRAATADASDAAQVQLQVDECRVSGADTAWLRAGRYLRFVFRVSGADELPEPLLALLARVPVTGQDTGVPEEQVWEMLSHAHTGCLHVIAAPGAGVRIQVWLPADDVAARAGAAGAGKAAGSGAASERLH